MSLGFNQSSKKSEDEVEKLLKKYKSIKKYMKSSFYQLKVMDGTETTVKSLLEEN
jgi:hypothetical protein